MNLTTWCLVAVLVLVSLLLSTAHALVLVAVSRSGQADFVARCNLQGLGQPAGQQNDAGLLHGVHDLLGFEPATSYSDYDNAVCTSFVVNLCVAVAYVQLLFPLGSAMFEEYKPVEAACSASLGIVSMALGGAFTIYAFYVTTHFKPCTLEDSWSPPSHYTDNTTLRHDSALKALG